MKTLIINCHVDERKVSSYVSWVSPYSDIVIIREENLENVYNHLNEVDAIVVTGSRKFAALGEIDVKLVNFIRKVDIPLFSICYGHQVMCYSYGCRLGHMEKPIKGIETVEIVHDDEIFLGLGKRIQVRESHYDYVVLEQDTFKFAGLTLLARSKSCQVEAVKLEKKPMYGTQFHPEKSGKVGQKIIENFFKHAVRK